MRRAVLQTVLGGLAWLAVVPVLRFTLTPTFGGSWLGLSIWLAVLVVAAMASCTAILIACARRAWGVALASLLLAAAGLVVTTGQGSPLDYADYQYHEHRAAFAALAREFRAGRLDGDLTLPAELAPLCPSGFAYADPGRALFIQLWQNWRAESGTGLAYLTAPPGPETILGTASGDQGHPAREVGDGWWWVE